MLEPVPTLAQKAIKLKKTNPKIKNIYVEKVEDHEFGKSYDVIWAGWFLVHVNDIKVLEFLIKTRNHINQNGKLILKDNINSPFEVYYSQTGIQKIRPIEVYRLFFSLTGLRVIIDKVSDNYPSDKVPLHEIVLAKN
jgi:hypothetical protein